MDIGWWISTGIVCVGSAVVCAYYEMKYRQQKKATDEWYSLWSWGFTKFSDICYRSMRNKLQAMHRRAQRAEAERDKARRYATLKRAEELVHVNDLVDLPKWYKKSGYCQPSQFYNDSKDIVVKDIAEFMKQSYGKRS